jgi:hypothetical protein
MDSLINNFHSISLEKQCHMCKKVIYNNDICRECFLNYLEFMDLKECCTCGTIFTPFSDEYIECDNCLNNY